MDSFQDTPRPASCEKENITAEIAEAAERIVETLQLEPGKEKDNHKDRKEVWIYWNNKKRRTTEARIKAQEKKHAFR